jgi:hypothetical protein
VKPFLFLGIRAEDVAAGGPCQARCSLPRALSGSRPPGGRTSELRDATDAGLCDRRTDPAVWFGIIERQAIRRLLAQGGLLPGLAAFSFLAVRPAVLGQLLGEPR